MSNGTTYTLEVLINNKRISRVTIDQHYKEKHHDINDEIILELVKEINGKNFNIEDEKNGFQYFAVEPVFYDEAPYRLVLLLWIFDDFLGVINAFRVQRKKHE